MKNQLEFDVIIIGSGVGGSTFADYLTNEHKNLKIAILESGPHRSKENFNNNEITSTALYYNSGAVLSKNLQIGVAAANTLGGGSAVYTGVSFRPPKKCFKCLARRFRIGFFNE